MLEGKPKKSCLEIGLGISPYFGKSLSSLFKRYVIIEKEIYKGKIPKGAELVNADWEKFNINEKFDVIIASHVIYYFNNKSAALKKIFATLSENGRAFIVVNGVESDYGPLKLTFSKIINKPYSFTYDELKNLLSDKNFKEHTLPSVIKFQSYNDLFKILKLSFDSYPKKYESHKSDMIKYFKNNISGNKFIIDQKIFEITNKK